MADARAELGQYFTPRPIVDFAMDALSGLGARFDGACVLDPACGPGEWLCAALERGAAQAIGVDCDPAMIAAWREAPALPGGGCHVIIADALLPGALPAGAFDFVVGNPPFGAELRDSREATLRRMATHYHLPWRDGRQRSSPSGGDLERLRRIPTELLFLERFVELCRPGGWIAVVLPEGLLANSRWSHARRWLLRTVTVHAVIALPREAFRAHATSASTCLLLMERRPPAAGHLVALAGVTECASAAFAELLAALQRGGDVVGEPPDGLLPPPLFRT